MDLLDQLQEHLGDAFKIERELGGGGMSRVFVATEVRLNRQVAIKVLSPELAQGLNAERFEREILLAASLQQANIVPVLAAGEVGGLPYFTMPFIAGEALRGRIADGEMPISDVTHILRDVAKALAHAHAQGIVHRDIKPDNVLLSGGTAMVTDFGIAKALAASKTGPDEDPSMTLTQVGTSIGTPPYMAPEQVAGDPNLDHRVDIYALGCMAFELLTGKTPFADRPGQRMLAAHLSEVPADVASLRSDCPAELSTLVAALLEKEPADRPATATEVVRRVDEVGTVSGTSSILSGPGAGAKVLGLYAVATVAVWVLAKAAVVGIGLPDWTVTGAVGLMLIGLPPLLFTVFAKQVSRRVARATPTMTPGGTVSVKPQTGTITNIALKAAPHLSVKRWAQYGVAAMSAFVLLVAAFMVTRSMGIGPAASLFAAGSLESQDRIVLADFQTSAGDEDLAPIVQEAVRKAMSQSTAVRLLGASDVANVLRQMQRPVDTPLAGEVAGEVAERAGAKAYLRGRLVNTGGENYVLSVELVGTANAEVLASAQASGELLSTVDKATKELRGKIGESLREVQRAVPLARATTASLEALRKYTEAQTAFSRDGDADRAVTLVREAVALDPTFALAWRALAITLLGAGAPPASVDSALDRAYRFADRLPPLERALAEGAYFGSHTDRGDRQLALEAYRRAYSADSLSKIALENLAALHSVRADYDSALIYVHRSWQTDTTSMGTRVQLAAAMVQAGDRDGATALIERPLSEGKLNDMQRFQAATILFGQEETEQAIALLDSVVETPVIPVRNVALIVRGALQAELGRIEEALESYGAGVDAFGARYGSSEIGAIAVAEIEFRYGERERTIADLRERFATEAWQGKAQTRDAYLFAVWVLAEHGFGDEARTLLARGRAAWPGSFEQTEIISIIDLVEAHLALAEGRAEEALQQYRSAGIHADGRPTGSGAEALVGAGRAFDLLGQPDSAITAFESYLAIPDMLRGGFDMKWLAVVRRRLGELYDAKGNTAQAMKYYGDFVNQWRDADAHLQPAVETVRARMAELQASEGTQPPSVRGP